MECINELSAHLAVQHTDVALPSVLTTCYYIPNFHWNAHILFEAPQECNLECDVIYTHNTISHLSNWFLIQSEN